MPENHLSSLEASNLSCSPLPWVLFFVLEENNTSTLFLSYSAKSKHSRSTQKTASALNKSSYAASLQYFIVILNKLCTTDCWIPGGIR
jgi:hypothetical protein